MKLVVFRPEGAEDLAQGKAYSPPPWVSRHPSHLAALKGQDTAQQFSLAPLGRLNVTGAYLYPGRRGHKVFMALALG